jgi:glucose/arabinose dehydrogenase
MHPRTLALSLTALLLSFLAAEAAVAQLPPAVTLRQVATGLSSPVQVTHAGDGSGRIFIVQKGGSIRILKNGSLLPTAFLSIPSLISTSGERGLLGLAFHPQYQTNRRFFVFYARASDGALRVSSFTASLANPDVADTGSEQPVITVPHPGQDNHNGGHIAFGPDGYLYIATGDGGGGGDTSNNAQNLNVLLGKLLRLDVSPASGYTIPPTNPFASGGGAAEIWAYGLRNPWKFSFDRYTGDLYIGDVGQETIEEINFQPAGVAGGRNYGWRVFEGNNCYNPQTNCSLPNHTPPILTYNHGSGNAVTGGYVYRGVKSRALRGFYIYSDSGSSRVWAATRFNNSWVNAVLIEPPSVLSGVTSFGEDESGEIYVASFGNGRLYAIDGPAPGVGVQSDLNDDGRSDILLRNPTTGENYLYPMNGTTILGTEGYIRTVTAPWEIAAVANFDGNAHGDILLRNTVTGENYIYFMNGAPISNEGYIRSVPPEWVVAGAADFDGDGKADILWRNPNTGENYIFPMDGLAIKATEGYVRSVSTAWSVAALADFDGDGMADILLTNPSSGEIYLYPMNGTAIKATEGYIRSIPTSWVIAGAGDFTGDARADILLRNATTGENYIFPMNGTTIFPTEGYVRSVPTGWNVARIGDYDGDGKADILWRNPTTGENYLYPMNGTAIKGTEGYIRSVPTDWNIVGK